MQIAPDGQLPQEEARTNSVGYVAFDLLGLLQLGLMSRHPSLAGLVPDLLTYTTKSNHTGVQAVVDHMVPFVLGKAPWPYQNLDDASWGTYFEHYSRAASAWPEDGATYAAVVRALPGGNSTTNPTSLLWPLVGL